MQLADFALERFFARYEFNSRYLLCSSDSEPVTTSELLRLANVGSDALLQLQQTYAESRGSMALRSAIAGNYRQLGANDVLVAAGGQDAIACTFAAVVRPGDDVLAVVPTYQSLVEMPSGFGARVREVHLRRERRFAYDVNEIIHHIQPNTRLVTLATPNNPTGAVLGEAELRQLCEALNRTGTYLLCDEIYRDLLSLPPPAAADVYDKAISVSGLAKAYGLPGLRIGWLATKDAVVLQRAAAFKDYTSICSSVSSDYLATLALGPAKSALLQAARLRVNERRKVVQKFVLSHSRWFDWLESDPSALDASTLSLLAWKGSGSTAELCDRLVKDASVLLMPGELFGYPGTVRLGVGRAGFEQGLALLSQHLNKHKY